MDPINLFLVVDKQTNFYSLLFVVKFHMEFYSFPARNQRVNYTTLLFLVLVFVIPNSSYS